MLKNKQILYFITFCGKINIMKNRFDELLFIGEIVL